MGGGVDCRGFIVRGAGFGRLKRGVFLFWDRGVFDLVSCGVGVCDGVKLL